MSLSFPTRSISRRRILRSLGMASLNYAIFPGLGKAIQQRDTGDGPVPPRATLPKWSINAMQAHLSKPSPNLVLLAAHRGLWRDTPENSEPGIRSPPSMSYWIVLSPKSACLKSRRFDPVSPATTSVS